MNLKRIEKPLSQLTTLRLGGAAKTHYLITSKEDWADLGKILDQDSSDIKILGGGANLLVCDQGPSQTLLSLSSGELIINADTLIVDAGQTIAKTAISATRASLSGLEWATSIPGTWGGALTMNAGAYGSNTGEHVQWVELIDKDFEFHRIQACDVVWEYRHSHWPLEVLCFTRLAFKLTPSDKNKIRSRQEEIKEQRISKFPKAPCAGSTFKNPEGLPAGKLIEDCGLKGNSIGGAMIPYEHANIFIHRDGSAKDLIHLILQSKKRVYEETGVLLKPEVILWDQLSYEEWEVELFGKKINTL